MIVDSGRARVIRANQSLAQDCYLNEFDRHRLHAQDNKKFRVSEIANTMKAITLTAMRVAALR